MKKLRVYISHSISDGGVLTKDIMEKNCSRAIEFANWLRTEFPSIEIYCPAEHEDFVHKTYTKGLLTIPQILDIDCDIISGCDEMILFMPNDKLSAGMQVEVDHCRKNHIPMFAVGSEYHNPFELRWYLEKWFRNYDYLRRNQ